MQKRFFRVILLIAGVLTVLVILLSPSLYSLDERKSAHKDSEQAPVTTVIQAPSDVVTSPSVYLDDPSTTIVKSTSPDEKTVLPFYTLVQTLSPYLATLFRSIISPNAP